MPTRTDINDDDDDPRDKDPGDDSDLIDTPFVGVRYDALHWDHEVAPDGTIRIVPLT